MAKRKPISPEAAAEHAADAALAARFDDLFAQAREAERALRDAQANGASPAELHRAGKRLDTALTDVMRAAFAAQRAEIGPGRAAATTGSTGARPWRPRRSGPGPWRRSGCSRCGRATG